MGQKQNSGQAFPFSDGTISNMQEGMTLRDYFAAKAMQAGLTGATLPGLAEGSPETLEALRSAVKAFWLTADEMVAARDK